MKAIAIHPCCFGKMGTLCHAGRIRVFKAISVALKDSVTNFVISGGVPYDAKNGTWLAVSMAFLVRGVLNKLKAQNRPKGCREYNIVLATNCYNSSTDIQDILEKSTERGFDEIIVVSSYWHLWVLRPMYKYWLEKKNLAIKVSFESPRSRDCGLITLLIYFGFRFFTVLSMKLGLFEQLDRLLNKRQEPRKKGYKTIGCA